jgi:hypothetical protein
LPSARAVRIFLSYSRVNKKAHGLFRDNLVCLENDDYVAFGDDPQIDAGDP